MLREVFDGCFGSGLFRLNKAERCNECAKLTVFRWEKHCLFTKDTLGQLVLSCQKIKQGTQKHIIRGSFLMMCSVLIGCSVSTRIDFKGFIFLLVHSGSLQSLRIGLDEMKTVCRFDGGHSSTVRCRAYDSSVRCRRVDDTNGSEKVAVHWCWQTNCLSRNCKITIDCFAGLVYSAVGALSKYSRTCDIRFSERVVVFPYLIIGPLWLGMVLSVWSIEPWQCGASSHGSVEHRAMADMTWCFQCGASSHGKNFQLFSFTPAIVWFYWARTFYFTFPAWWARGHKLLCSACHSSGNGLMGLYKWRQSDCLRVWPWVLTHLDRSLRLLPWFHALAIFVMGITNCGWSIDYNSLLNTVCMFSKSWHSSETQVLFTLDRTNVSLPVERTVRSACGNWERWDRWRKRRRWTRQQQQRRKKKQTAVLRRSKRVKVQSTLERLVLGFDVDDVRWCEWEGKPEVMHVWLILCLASDFACIWV